MSEDKWKDIKEKAKKAEAEEDKTVESSEVEEDFAELEAPDLAKASAAEPMPTQPSDQLEQRIQECKKETQEYKDKYLRSLADIDNLRRRHDEQLGKAKKFAIENLARELLEVIDNLERAVAQQPKNTENFTSQDSGLRSGVELTLKLFQSLLEKFSIKAIDPLHQLFDPHQHEAMSVQETAEHEPGTVLQVLQKGYLLHERLLRPALVTIAKAAVEKEAEKA